jgi:hypothetical protein
MPRYGRRLTEQRGADPAPLRPSSPTTSPAWMGSVSASTAVTLPKWRSWLSISGQTFYTSILENLDKFGALKAIGAKGRELVYTILFMATFTALTGYGLGIGLVTLVIAIARNMLPNYAAITTFWNLGLAFGMVVLIAGISSYIGVRKVLKIEPFDIQGLACQLRPAIQDAFCEQFARS